MKALYAESRQRKQPGVAYYLPGDAEYWYCVSKYYQGRLNHAAWQSGYDLAVRHRNITMQYQFLALRA